MIWITRRFIKKAMLYMILKFKTQNMLKTCDSWYKNYLLELNSNCLFRQTVLQNYHCSYRLHMVSVSINFIKYIKKCFFFLFAYRIQLQWALNEMIQSEFFNFYFFTSVLDNYTSWAYFVLGKISSACLNAFNSFTMS